VKLTSIQQDAVAEASQVLLREHASEWTHKHLSLLSFTVRSTRQGLFVILRALRLNPKRLASARILTSPPRDHRAWRRLRTQMSQRGLSKLPDAKHRYVFVPPSVAKRARQEFARTRVRIVALDGVPRTRS
jgi:hypothetical protein